MIWITNVTTNTSSPTEVTESHSSRVHRKIYIPRLRKFQNVSLFTCRVWLKFFCQIEPKNLMTCLELVLGHLVITNGPVVTCSVNTTSCVRFHTETPPGPAVAAPALLILNKVCTSVEELDPLCRTSPGGVISPTSFRAYSRFNVRGAGVKEEFPPAKAISSFQ